jgi:ATP-dependent exoDNAse (exonuclease V) beta subunit
MMSDAALEPMTLAAEDSAARDAALDVNRSFLIQAPAGSGKTALLMQRFLALLAGVDRPERIVAMTFTRKAAAEMRERIIEALHTAAAGTPGSSPHERRTHELACAALAQDARLGWQVAAHPARLQIHTIDALCASLVRQAPLASRLGAAPHFEERAAPLYRHAAEEALRSAAPGDRAWETLLRHIDNDAQRTIDLLADMLAKREQWLRELPFAADESLRQRLEATLGAETAGELAALHDAFPARLTAELPAVERYAAESLEQTGEAPELAGLLRACAETGGLPPTTPEALHHWRGLANWLLRACGEPAHRALPAACAL